MRLYILIFLLLIPLTSCLILEDNSRDIAFKSHISLKDLEGTYQNISMQNYGDKISPNKFIYLFEGDAISSTNQNRIKGSILDVDSFKVTNQSEKELKFEYISKGKVVGEAVLTLGKEFEIKGNKVKIVADIRDRGTKGSLNVVSHNSRYLGISTDNNLLFEKNKTEASLVLLLFPAFQNIERVYTFKRKNL